MRESSGIYYPWRLCIGTELNCAKQTMTLCLRIVDYRLVTGIPRKQQMARVFVLPLFTLGTVLLCVCNVANVKYLLSRR